MNQKELKDFIIKARKNTYAGDGGKVGARLEGTTQLEHKDGEFFYRDVYYTGKNTFAGLEGVYYKGKPVFAMSYYGNWGEMTEGEIDKILRGALVANPGTRLNEDVFWEKDGFKYECEAGNLEDITEIGGEEKITKNGKQVYRFYYAGSILWQ